MAEGSSARGGQAAGGDQSSQIAGAGLPSQQDEIGKDKESERSARLSILQRTRPEEAEPTEEQEERLTPLGSREREADLFVERDPKTRLETARRTRKSEGGGKDKEEGKEGQEQEEDEKGDEVGDPLAQKEKPPEEDEKTEGEEDQEGEQELKEEQEEEENIEEKVSKEEVELDGREKRFALTVLIVLYAGKFLIPGLAETVVSALSGSVNSNTGTTVPTYSELKDLVKKAKEKKERKGDASVYNKIKWFYYITWTLIVLSIVITAIAMTLLWVTLLATMRALYCYGPGRALIWLQSWFTGVDICK